MDWRRFSALQKFFLITAGLLGVLTVVLIWFSGRIVERAFAERIRATVVVAVKNEAAENLTPEDFRIADKDRARQIFAPVVQALKTAEIAKVKVWNSQSQVIYSDVEELIGLMFADNLAVGQALKGETIVQIEGEEEEEGGAADKAEEKFLEIYVPISYVSGDRPSGVIEAYYDLTSVNEQVATTQRILVAAIVGFTLVTFLLLVGFFREVIYKPLLKLQEAARLLAEGNLKGRVEVKSDDEMGRVGTAFNRMADELEKYTTGLQEEVKGGIALIREVVDTNPNLIFVKDEEGRFSLVNKAVAAFYGKTPAELLERKEEELGVNTQELAASWEAEKKVRGVGGSRVIEELRTDSAGSKRWYQTIKVTLEDRGRRQVLSVATDITERKEIESRRREVDELKNKFVTVVSHQLRTPLAAINWNLELLLGKELGVLETVQADLVRVAYSANKEVIVRIDDLLRALEIEEGKLRLEREEIRLDNVVKAVFEEARKAMETKKITGEIELPSETKPIVGDVTLLREVMSKLLENAVTYTPEGGRVKVVLKPLVDGWRVEFVDTGIGIPKEEQKNIFVRFQRASNAFSMKTDSSGLGLYIAKQIVTAHGGRIGFESEVGKGSTFWVELPSGAGLG